MAGQSAIWFSLGRILELERNYSEAQRAFERSLELGTESSDKEAVHVAHLHLSRVHAVQGRHREALAAFEAAVEIKDEIHDEEMDRSLTEMQTRFDVQRREQEIQLLKQQQAASEMSLRRQKETGALLLIGIGLALSVMFLALNRYRIQVRATAMAEEVKVLQGLLPICSHCKQIRDEEDEWSSLESYIDGHSEAQFSHSICPDCMTTHYPEVETS